MPAKIELKKENIFYRINDILYRKNDDTKDLNIILNDPDKDVNSARVTIKRPDGTVIDRVINTTDINTFLLEFRKNDCDKIGYYEFALKAFKSDKEVQFQKFFYTVADYENQFLFDEDGSITFDTVKKYIDDRLNNLSLEKY